ncbi:hypothetical protein TNCV_168841 [Trichonephila clavipes]|nr:hypothetical protein TNCV_168841 [Trichonephila clavipes]
MRLFTWAVGMQIILLDNSRPHRTQLVIEYLDTEKLSRGTVKPELQTIKLASDILAARHLPPKPLPKLRSTLKGGLGHIVPISDK